jgi:predicted outer membrane repeat protein
MWLLLSALCANATNYRIGADYPSLPDAIEAAVDDDAAGILVPPAVFQYSANTGAVAQDPFAIDVPFEVVIDANARDVTLPPLILSNGTYSLLGVHLLSGGETAIDVNNSTLLLEDVVAFGTAVAVNATSSAITVLGGQYVNHDQAFVTDQSDLTFGLDAYGLHAIIEACDAGAENGAGVFANGGNIVVDAVMSNNVATTGGAILAQGGATLTILPTAVFSWNYADYGGAIAVGGATLDVQGGTFDSNSAAVYGGTFYVELPTQPALITDANVIAFAFDADKGGGLYLSGNDTSQVVVTRGTWTSAMAQVAGGAFFAEGGAIDLVDAIVEYASASSVGGVIAGIGATLTVTGGTWTWPFATDGGGLYAIDSTVVIDGLAADQPFAATGAALAQVVGGDLTVRNLGVTPAIGSGSVIHTTDAAVTLTDLAISGARPVFGASDGAISVEGDAGTAVLTRVRLCDNQGKLGGSSLTVRGGAATLQSSFVWESSGSQGAIDVADGGDLTVTHTTFANNAGTAISLADNGSLWVSWSLFASQASNASALADPMGGVGVVGADNWLETDAIGAENGSDLGAAVGAVGFQVSTLDPWLPGGVVSTDQIPCDATFYLHWDAPQVDWASAPDTDQADVDGTAPDIGGYGGPEGWPHETQDQWDLDGDGDRIDLDCANDDPSQFPRNDPTLGDCRCDTDGDGFTDPSCPEAARSGQDDCDDGNATAFPGNTAEDIPGDGIDQDCRDGDAVGTDPGDTDGPGDTDPPVGDTDGEPIPGAESGLLFGGGGCAHAPAPPSGVALLLALALSRREKRR